MSIPFTQYMRPDGRKVPVTIARPDEIESLAQAFIDRGGWFECEHLTTHEVSLTACFNVDDEPEDIAIRVVPNGPEVPGAVDELVREVTKWMP